jgi:hypothetical protein
VMFTPSGDCFGDSRLEIGAAKSSTLEDSMSVSVLCSIYCLTPGRKQSVIFTQNQRKTNHTRVRCVSKHRLHAGVVAVQCRY